LERPTPGSANLVRVVTKVDRQLAQLLAADVPLFVTLQRTFVCHSDSAQALREIACKPFGVCASEGYRT
jgi:hypothetical protein